jgi:hypothetical protein
MANARVSTQTTMEQILERLLKSIETKVIGDEPRLFFPKGIELIQISAKASSSTPNFEFEIKIAGPSALKPIAGASIATRDLRSVQEVCEELFEENKNDCNKFAKAVAGHFGITLEGKADDIVDTIKAAPRNYIGKDLAAASKAADLAGQGKLVIGGLKAEELKDTNGHVVVVVPGDLVNGKYPHAYWGSITSGKAKKNQGVNYAFVAPYRDSVNYGWIEI